MGKVFKNTFRLVTNPLLSSPEPVFLVQGDNQCFGNVQNLVEKQASIFENFLLDYQQAARLLCISEAHLRRLKNQGKIPYVEVGRCVRFDPESLKEWIKKREIG